MASLIRREDDMQLNHTMVTLLTVLLVLLILTLLLIGALLFLRQKRRARKALLDLPLYSEKDSRQLSTSTASSSHLRHHHRRSRSISVRPSQSIHIYHDNKETRIENDSSSLSAPSSPTSSLPEIRITFPEEVDSSGKRQSGRVMVVHVGDTGVGLEPCGEKVSEDGERNFESVDLEKVGGLVETETR